MIEDLYPAAVKAAHPKDWGDRVQHRPMRLRGDAQSTSGDHPESGASRFTEAAQPHDARMIERWWWILLACVCIAGIAAWRLAEAPVPWIERRPLGIMGTDALLRCRGPAAAAALAESEQALRQVEAQMSSWIEASDIGRVNAAPAGQAVAVRPATRALLGRAQNFFQISGGRFDVTCGPLIRLWRAAGAQGQRPAADALTAARSLCGWRGFTLTDDGVIKELADARIDLGGIAKGLGIDRAVTALQEAGQTAGLVEVGGDLRVFGAGPHEGFFHIAIATGEDDTGNERLRLLNAAVATSAPTHRFSIIDGRRYSHIVDPASGEALEEHRQVTVVAPQAVTADAWATALSVLGPTGLTRLPEGVEARLLRRTADGDWRHESTPGFSSLLLRR